MLFVPIIVRDFVEFVFPEITVLNQLLREHFRRTWDLQSLSNAIPALQKGGCHACTVRWHTGYRFHERLESAVGEEEAEHFDDCVDYAWNTRKIRKQLRLSAVVIMPVY